MMKFHVLLLALVISSACAINKKHQNPKSSKRMNLARRDVLIYRNKLGKFRDGKVKTHEIIDQFYESLKSFVNETHFDDKRFASEMENHPRFPEIELLMYTEFSAAESDHFQSVRTLFWAMMDYINRKPNHQSIEPKAHELICKIMEQNILVLTLYNSYGYLDTSVEYMINRVSQHYAATRLWRRELMALPDVSVDIRLVFDIQISKALKSLEGLKKLMRLSDHYCFSLESQGTCLDF